MSVIILLLIISISVAALFLAAFIWSVKVGQYQDEIAPAVRILFDDHQKKSNTDKAVNHPIDASSFSITNSKPN